VPLLHSRRLAARRAEAERAPAHRRDLLPESLGRQGALDMSAESRSATGSPGRDERGGSGGPAAGPPSQRVGFIGLGTMGGPMATNLAKASVPLAVYDVNQATREALAQLPGVLVDPSPAAVASHASVVFTCLPNDAIVREVYLGSGGIAAGARPGVITCDC